MYSLMQDLRYALRTLRKRPGFTAVAVLTLGLGIGATTAIFSAVDHVVLRPLPYDESGRVLTLWETNLARGELHNEVSPGNFIEWQARAESFESMGLAEPYGVDLTGGDGPPRAVPTWAVTEGFFDALGVRPILGPGFGPEHFRPGGPAAVMISHDLWLRSFDSDPTLVGRTIEVNGVAVLVAGVLPPWLAYPAAEDIWIPKRYRPDEPADRVSSYMYAVARLAPGVSAEEAQAELDAVAATLADEFPRTNADVGVRVVPLEKEILGGVRPALLVLLGAVAFLLLIACANVAHLALARAAERSREMSVRASLGAGRARLARQAILESLLLAGLGGIAGVALAAVGVDAIVALSPPEIPRLDAIEVDGRVLAFAAVVTLATAVLSGCLPGLRLSRSDGLTALGHGRRSHSSGRDGVRMRDGLVVAQVAVATILLVGAGLLARSFTTLVSEDLGFAVERHATVQAFLWDLNPTAEQRIQQVAEIDRRFESLPGVEAAAVVNALPFHPTRLESRLPLEVVGRPMVEGTAPEAVIISASPDYFDVMEIPLRRGRMYERAQPADATTRVVINQTLARQFFNGENPVGRRATISTDGGEATFEVVGVVGDVRPTSFASEPDPTLFMPYKRTGGGGVTFVVHTRGEAAAAMPALRRAFWRADPNQSIYHAATMEGLVSETLVAREFYLLLIGVFSVAALVLAAVGIFGVISFASSRRAHEIGIRMALGARAPDVLRMIVSRGAALALLGVGVGIAAALGLTRFVSSMLYGVSATDPLTLAGVGVVMTGVAALASYLPARRAAGSDPSSALKQE